MKQDLQRLKKISEGSCYGKQLNKILDSSKRLALEINSSKLTSTISDDLKYESGGHYHRTMEYEKEYGGLFL
jgi:hypothetical protein